MGMTQGMPAGAAPAGRGAAPNHVNVAGAKLLIFHSNTCINHVAPPLHSNAIVPARGLQLAQALSSEPQSCGPQLHSEPEGRLTVYKPATAGHSCHRRGVVKLLLDTAVTGGEHRAHADPAGSEALNRALANDHANVVELLQDRGVAGGHFAIRDDPRQFFAWLMRCSCCTGVPGGNFHALQQLHRINQSSRS
eukprot:358977-Chlamydomonas_euryale.AAC.1